MADWDARYAEAGWAFGTEPNDFLREQAQHLPAGGQVLCLAEGEGRNAVWLAQQGFHVTGIDVASVGLEKAQQLARERGVRITTVVADLASFELGSAAWDSIVSIFAHVPASVRRRVHASVLSALKPGACCCSRPTVRSSWSTPPAVRPTTSACSISAGCAPNWARSSGFWRAKSNGT